MRRVKQAAFLTLTAVAMMSFTPVWDVQAVQETSGECGEALIWELAEDGTLTISGTGAMTDWKYTGHGSTSIWDKNTDITKVVIEEGVTSIGNYAFYGCSRISEVDLADSVGRIGDSSFSGCNSLTELTLPVGVTSLYPASSLPRTLTSITAAKDNPMFTSVDGVLFSKDMSILLKYPASRETSEYAVPNDVKLIGGYAFYYATSLSKVEIPDSIEEIGFFAFGHCSSLGTADIPRGVKSIGKGGFLGCTCLERAVVPSGITVISDNMFADCTSLVDAKIPEGVTELGVGAFRGCVNLETVTLPESLEIAEAYLFEGCTSMKSVTYPEGIRLISWKQFDGQHDMEPAGIEKVVILSTDCEICDDQETFPENVVIYGYTNSTAQRYAEKYGRRFVTLGESQQDAVCGDINGDGTLSVSDVVLLQKWLLAVPNTSLPNWKAADLCTDDKLDVFDLCMIKSVLLDPPPM